MLEMCGIKAEWESRMKCCVKEWNVAWESVTINVCGLFVTFS